MFRTNRIILTILVLSSAQVIAQKGTQSPYSAFGLGELNQGQYASFTAMGNISTACADSTIVNPGNPASYAYFNRNHPVFQFGANGKFSTFETSNASSNQSTFGLNQIMLGLPVKKNWGAAFGLMPYSFTGYTIANYSVVDGDTLNQFINEGSGAISRAFLGVSYKPVNISYLDTNQSETETRIVLKKHILTIGVNGNYLFGSTDRVQSYEYYNLVGAYNSRVRNALRISDANVDFGFNYQYYFRPTGDSLMNGSVSVGASYTPGFQLRAYQDLLSYTYFGSFYGNTYDPSATIVDTVENVTDNQGTIFIPDQYKLGIEYRFGWQPSRKGERQLRVGVDLSYQKWSEFYEDFGSGAVYSPLRDRLGVGLGLEYCPVVNNDPSINILARTNYRFGFNYTQTELSINGTDLDDYGMSFGIGLPMNINSTNTSINLGAKLGSMGTTDNGLIREKYIGVFFGISITPDRNERWFVKRKYD